MLYDTFYLSLDYLFTIIPVMVIGVVAAEFLVEIGWVHKIGFIVSPMTRFAHLREECSISFITAFGSPAASNSMLKKLYDDGLALLGMAGMIYLGILTAVGLLRTLVTILIGHFLLGEKQYIPNNTVHQRVSFLNAFRISIKKSKKTIFRIITTTIPVTILVFALIDAGFFEVLAAFLKEHAVSIRILIPYYVGIFGSKLGTQIMVYSAILREGILVVATVILALSW